MPQPMLPQPKCPVRTSRLTAKGRRAHDLVGAAETARGTTEVLEVANEVTAELETVFVTPSAGAPASDAPHAAGGVSAHARLVPGCVAPPQHAVRSYYGRTRCA
jgi:hypothetical protein